jgi:hypothetical protein
MSDFSAFIEQNDGFILTFSGLMGTGITLCLMCILKSRCSYIKCCGVECKRNVIPTEELNNIRVSTT